MTSLPVSTEPGLTIDQVVEFLKTVEWYDNSRLESIQGCKRKGFYQLIGPTGTPLAKRVGEGADFGSVIHAAHESYYTDWGRLTEERRRFASFITLDNAFSELFPNGPQTKNHTLLNARDIWDDCCDKWIAEDPLYEPVDPEVGFIIRIYPRLNEPTFKPFWYLGRADGVWKRLSMHDYFIGEVKTTSGGVARRIKSLTFNNQPVGYVSLAREAVRQGRFVDGVTDPMAIIGHFAIVIAVQVLKREQDREFFPVEEWRSENWRKSVIRQVEEWRNRKRDLEMILQDNRDEDTKAWQWIYYPETEECTKYGLCPYWDLCHFGVTADSLSDFEPDTWNPLLGNRPLPRTIIENNEDGTIRLTR